MAWQYVAAAGAAIIGAKLLSSEPSHDDTVQSTHDRLLSNTPRDATVYADHIDDGPNPRGELDGVDHVPDVLVKAGSSNSLIVEVETADSLREARPEARAQIRSFRKQGYRRVLVVPDGQEDDEAVTSFVDDTDGVLNVETPNTVHTLL